MTRDETSDPAPPGRHDKALAFAKEGAKTLGVASLKILLRTVAWGTLGLVVGLVAWNALYWGGLLEIEWEHWRFVVWVLLPLYACAGAGALGYAGVWRGVGRAVLYVGIERGLVVYLVEEILDRLIPVMRRSEKLSGALDQSRRFLENLPLQEWEVRLHAAVEAYLADRDEVVQGAGGPGLRARIAGRLRTYLSRKIERYLLAIVRQEVDEHGEGGGISLERVRAVALEKVEDVVEDLVTGMMNKQLLIAAAILLLVLAIAPAVAHFV